MMPQGSREPKSRVILAAVVLIAAVLLRGWFFLEFDESYFDSDQAIVGLMAKHLVEGRALPLFFYGQEYMLGVEAPCVKVEQGAFHMWYIFGTAWKSFRPGEALDRVYKIGQATSSDGLSGARKRVGESSRIG